MILENHLHWIAVGPDLAKQVGNFKSFTAKQIFAEMQRRNYATLLQELKFYKLRHKVDQVYQTWQEGSHPKQISTDQMMWQKSNTRITIRYDEGMWMTHWPGDIRAHATMRGNAD